MDNNASATAANLAVITTAAQLTSAFPDLVASIRTEAATFERSRILGIAALADGAPPALISEMQADASVSPEKAAVRILGAQREARGLQLQAIQDVEKVTAAVAPTASSSAALPGDGPKPKASTPDGWKAEYEASAELQTEFGSAAGYVAYQNGLACGAIKIKSDKAA